jgi:segregation and condensation protein A
MAYEVRLAAFEGPLDLLLHLIEKEEMNIYEIEIAPITDQYIAAMHRLGLDDISDFIVMAATLLYIKSKQLLPVHQELVDEDAEEFAIDSREALIEKLIEYKKYKHLAETLRELESERSNLYTRKPIDFAPYYSDEQENPIGDTTLFQLIAAFDQILLKQTYKLPYTRLEQEIATVEDKIEELLKMLVNNNGTVMFSDIFKHNPSKQHLLLTFLGMLELLKKNAIFCAQDSNFQDIRITYNAKWGESKFGLQ